MTARWVINASAVILLSKAKVIHVLPKLCDELIVPRGVAQEVGQGELSDDGRTWLAGPGRSFVREVGTHAPGLEFWRGGAGEAEVFAWAVQNPGFTAVLDDRRARTFAQELGIPLIGSLRVIVMAREKNLIPSAKAALEQLRGAGAYVSDNLIDRAIELSGE